MPIEKLKELKDMTHDVKEDIYKLEKQMYSILDNPKDDIQFFESLFNIQEEISKNPAFHENGITEEFYKLFKILIFLSSKIDTRDKEFRSKLFNILEDFKNSKKNMIDLSDNYIELFERLIKLLENKKDKNDQKKITEEPKKQNNFFKNIIDLSTKSKPIGIAFSIIIVFLFIFIIKVIDQTIYDDIKKTVLQPTAQKIIKITKE